MLAWEPGWVSSNVPTRWGTGSTWENVAFFDFKNEMLKHGGMDFLNDNNGKVTFLVDVPGAGADTAGDLPDQNAGCPELSPASWL